MAVNWIWIGVWTLAIVLSARDLAACVLAALRTAPWSGPWIPLTRFWREANSPNWLRWICPSVEAPV